MKINNYLLYGVVMAVVFSCKTEVILDNAGKTADNPIKEANYIPYYLKVYQADSLFLSNNYQRSYEILDSLFQKYQPLNMEGYNEYGNYIASSVLSGHLKGIEKKAKKGFINFGSIITTHQEADKLYGRVIKAAGLSENDIKLLKQKYSEKINLELRKRIGAISDEEQSAKANYQQEVVSFFQEKHSRELDEIITKYGYPNYQIIGPTDYANDKNPSSKPIGITALLLNQDKNSKEKYLPLLLDGLKKGKCSPSDYAVLFDKILWQKTEASNNPKQFYGSFPQIPLLNPAKIDSIRKSIGLPRLGYELWSTHKIFGKN